MSLVIDFSPSSSIEDLSTVVESLTLGEKTSTYVLTEKAAESISLATQPSSTSSSNENPCDILDDYCPINLLDQQDLIWRKILENLSYADRYSLRYVNKAIQAQVDNFCPAQIFAVIGTNIEKTLARFDLFSRYSLETEQNENESFEDQHSLHERCPRVTDIIHMQDLKMDSDGMLMLPRSPKISSYVFNFSSRFTRTSQYYPRHVNLSFFKYAENLEFIDLGVYKRQYPTDAIDLIGDFNRIRLPKLRRLVAFSCSFPNLLTCCPNLEVLKITHSMLHIVRSQVDIYARENKRPPIKKLHLNLPVSASHINIMKPNFLSMFDLNKFTLVLNKKSLNSAIITLEFFHAKHVSIRFRISDFEWDGELEYKLRIFLDGLQKQQRKQAFKLTLNGLLWDAALPFETIYSYLSNFLRAPGSNQLTINRKSADRFRSSFFFKELTVSHLNTFSLPMAARASYLRKLEITIPVTDQFLNNLPKKIPLLQKFTLLGSVNQYRQNRVTITYDLSFLLNFKYLMNLKLANFIPRDREVLPRLIDDLKYLRIFRISFKYDREFLSNLYYKLSEKCDCDPKNKYAMTIANFELSHSLVQNPRMPCEYSSFDNRANLDIGMPSQCFFP